MDLGVGRRNRNRGYQQLRVWQEAIEFYRICSRVFARFPFTLSKVAAQNVASADPIHRNIAEGYCSRSLREYLKYLYIALASLGETVSGLTVCRHADQISDSEFESCDLFAFQLENGLLKLVTSLERKQDSGTWIDRLVVRESNASYGAAGREESEFIPDG